MSNASGIEVQAAANMSQNTTFIVENWGGRCVAVVTAATMAAAKRVCGAGGDGSGDSEADDGDGQRPLSCALPRVPRGFFAARGARPMPRSSRAALPGFLRRRAARDADASLLRRPPLLQRVRAAARTPSRGAALLVPDLRPSASTTRSPRALRRHGLRTRRRGRRTRRRAPSSAALRGASALGARRLQPARRGGGVAGWPRQGAGGRATRTCAARRPMTLESIRPETLGATFSKAGALTAMLRKHSIRRRQCEPLAERRRRQRRRPLRRRRRRARRPRWSSSTSRCTRGEGNE